MVQSGKVPVFILLLFVILVSGCYTSFKVPPASERQVERQYEQVLDGPNTEQYTGKVVLPSDARDRYDWNFYYNSAWWYDYYEYVPNGRASSSGGYGSGGNSMITGPSASGGMGSGSSSASSAAPSMYMPAQRVPSASSTPDNNSNSDASKQSTPRRSAQRRNSQSGSDSATTPSASSSSSSTRDRGERSGSDSNSGKRTNRR